MSAWSWLKRSFVEAFEPALSGAWDGGASAEARRNAAGLPITPEEIEAVWAGARVTVRAERRARLRRAMGRQP